MALETSSQSYESLGKPKSFGDSCTKSRTGVCNCNVPAGEGMANYTSAQSTEKLSGVATKGL